MTIGIMGAMPEEVEGLSKDLKIKVRETLGQREYLIGTLEGREVVLVFSRMGKVAAASTVTTLIERYHVSEVVFTGVAGALDPSLEIGDVVISTELVQHDFDASFLPNFKRYEIPLLGMTHFEADKTLISRSQESAEAYLTKHFPHAKVRSGVVVSGDQFLTDPVHIERIRKDIPGSMCVEMEGAAIAQVCHEHAVPFVVIRAISDKANHDAVVDFPKFVRDVASPISQGLVRELLRRT